MIKIISGKKYRKMNEEMDSLRLQNNESHKSLTQLEGYAESLRLEVDLKNAEVKSREARIELLKIQNESLARDRMSLQEENSLMRSGILDRDAIITKMSKKEDKLKNDISLLDGNIKQYRIDVRDFKNKNMQDVARIEELETELKLAKNKANSLAEQSLKDKETIQNLRNDITLFKEEIAGKENTIADLREKIEICKNWTAPIQPTNEVPNTMQAVELGAVAPLEAEVVTVQKSGQPGPSYPVVEAVKSLGTAIANAGQALNPVVGNVKRRYQKTGKFKKRK